MLHYARQACGGRDRVLVSAVQGQMQRCCLHVRTEGVGCRSAGASARSSAVTGATEQVVFKIQLCTKIQSSWFTAK